MFVPQIKRIFAARRMFVRGRLAEGTVVFVKKPAAATIPGWPGTGGPVEVFISYRDAAGRQQEARAWCPNEWLTGHLAPGAAVHIAYLPHKPGDAVLLAAFLR